jgi:hypothetical protein
MDLRLLMPRACEAERVSDPEHGEEVLKPFFRRADENIRIVHLRVESEKPNTPPLLYTLSLSGKTGELKLHRVRNVRSQFDGGSSLPRPGGRPRSSLPPATEDKGA